MNGGKRWFPALIITAAVLLSMAGVAYASTPLDEAAAKLGAFVQKAGLILMGLIPSVSGVAVSGLAIKRAVSKAVGEEDGMVRANNQITEVLKLTAIGMGAALIVAIAGSVLA